MNDYLFGYPAELHLKSPRGDTLVVRDALQHRDLTYNGKRCPPYVQVDLDRVLDAINASVSLGCCCRCPRPVHE